MNSESIKNKSIALLCAEFPPGPGGIGNQAEGLSRYLSDQGFTIQIYTAARSEFSHGEYDKKSVFKIKRYAPGRNFLFKVIGSLYFLLSLRKVDWVILSGRMQLLLVIPIRIVTRAKTMSIVHGSELDSSKLLKWTLHKALSLTNQVIAVSEFTRSKLLAYGVTRSVEVISNGVAVNDIQVKNRFRSTSIGRLNLVTVGSITQRKGQHNVVKALPYIVSAYNQVMYHMIGMPVQAQKITELAMELGVDRFIKIHGTVNEEEKIKILKASDVFLMLSENLNDGDVEGFGIAILEANLLGLPAIGSRDTGIEQAINHEVTGLLIDNNSPQQLVQAIKVTLEKYNSFSQSSVEWALRHDWSIIGEKYLKILSL